MHKFFKTSLMIVLFCSRTVFATETDDQAMQQKYLEESRQIAKAFMQSLGSTLKAQLESDNAVSAIGVCKHIAPALAADYSNEDMIVTRVSLKNRNKTLGKPDAWERAVLENFDKQKSQNAAALEVSEVMEDPDGRWFRYMKAIPTQAMCLQCHGQPSDISAGVKAIVAKEYPEDNATGYRVGDIRGAVSIKQKWPIQP